MSHPDGPHTGRPPTYAPRGMVAAPHSLASESGLRVLRRGGSAADAAIAASAVLCVVYPHMSGLGADGFWLVHDPRLGGAQGLNASGPAARLATREYYRERGHTERIPERGPLAALTVPGVVDGWRAAHERWGRLPWRELFDDALHLAREGAPVGRSLARWIARDVPQLRQHAAAGRVYLRDGGRRREGERLLQPAMARSLETVAARGAREGFYEGPLAERICSALGAAGSPLRPDDFAAFRAEWVEPLSTTYRDCTVHQLPPNAQGFAALQILNLIEGYDVAGWGDGTLRYYHHMVEACKLALADRDAWLTDPRFVEIPLDRLLSKRYAAERRGRIDAEHAMPPAPEPGIAFAEDARRPAPGGDTCYLCAVDEDGLAASVIQSLYFDFGSLAMGGDTGILLQNRGSFLQLDDRHPNRLEPGKRSFHTLMPALACRDGSPWLVFGTMGGEGQPQTQTALVTRLVDFGYDVQQAIEAPRWLMGRTWGQRSDELHLEGRISQEVVRHLAMRGQPVTVVGDWDDSLGHAQAIRIDAQTGFLEGGADPRGDGAALGY